MCGIYLAERVVWSKFLRTVRINQESLCHVSSFCSQNTDPTAQSQNAVCRPGNQFHSLYGLSAHVRDEIRRPTKAIIKNRTNGHISSPKKKLSVK